VGASTVPTVTPAKLHTEDAIMATTTITDLPDSRALDSQAMSAIRGAGAGDWCLYAFSPYEIAQPPMAIYETNYFADQMNLQVQNIDIKDSGSGAINVNTAQNALNLIYAGPTLPHS
jgi:hypothetical protein